MMEDCGVVRRKRPKAVVVGGSIAGVCCAHALIAAGWEVVVVEKSSAPPSGSATGAGLGLDTLSQSLIRSWLPQPQLLLASTLSLSIDQNQVIDVEKKIRTLTRDENFNFRAAYWADLHSLLCSALPPSIFLWGHLLLSFCISDDKTSVEVKTKVLQTGNIVFVAGDLLVAADGCNSLIRQHFFPHLKLRYSGYCAWRGILDFSDFEESEIMRGIKEAYPDLGKCLYFDLSSGTHAVLYELPNKKINWIWYITQPEPGLKGNSVTMKVSDKMIKEMKEAAEHVWIPEFVRIIKETEEPFLNVIYDCDPLEHISWDNVVLIGDAAHPTTPHGLRSTNLSILDAAVLGKCLQKWGADNLLSALQEYQFIQLPLTSKQVLHSRWLGQIKQGFSLPHRNPFDPKTASLEDCQELQQRYMPYFSEVPSILM